jgi:O-antigen/teichoic acid export membrane protein
MAEDQWGLASIGSAIPSRFFVRGLSLISFNVAQFFFPLARTLILARILSSFEFGFVSALSASYSTFELITDIAIHRFVFASPRSEYQEALAGAHGLSILRGAAAGMLACAAAPGLAYLMSLSADWMSFAWLGLAIFIRSFEHFEVRVAERDYQYNPQLIANLLANGASLVAMIATWLYVQDHTIYIAMLFTQNLVSVLASHWLAKSPYRLDFKSQYFRKAARFSYPLLFSGVGLAAVSQGDRLLVGSVLDLPTLGLYSVITLAVTVPMAAIVQVSTSLVFAGLHNAAEDRERFQCRLLLYMRITLILGVCFALGVLGFMDVVVPFVFGPRFTVAKGIIALLAATSFLSIARGEPTTSVLLVNHRTRTLAMLSLSTVVGLLAATVLALFYRNLYAVLLGRLVGDIVVFGITMTTLRGYIRELGWRPFIWSWWAAGWIAFAIVFYAFSPVSETFFVRLSILMFLAMICVGGLTIQLRSMMARAYSRSS